MNAKGLKSIIDFKSNLEQARQYIKENFNVDSEYNEDENILYIKTNNVNESLNVLPAEEYLMENLESLIDIRYGI